MGETLLGRGGMWDRDVGLDGQTAGRVTRLTDPFSCVIAWDRETKRETKRRWHLSPQPHLAPATSVPSSVGRAKDTRH